MKKTFSIALITLLALSTLKANAAIINSNDIRPIIEKQMLQNYKQYTDSEIKIESLVFPFRDIEIPNGKMQVKVSSNIKKFMPRDLERVAIYVNGNCIKTFNVAVVVKAYKNVLVASTEINRGNWLNTNIVKEERRDVSNIMDTTLELKDLDKELLAKKYFIQGELIDRRFVKAKPDILRNSLVTVLFNTNNLTITIEATALSDGSIGDNICIMNKNYNKIYKGTIIGENKVMVKI